MAGLDRRDGRGRLSSIEMLPEEADEAIAWANAELRERKMPQTEILRQFNAMLADKAIKSVSKGAFSRYSIRRAIEMRKLEASREITDAVLGRMEPTDRSDATIGAVELLKHRVVELVMNTDEVSGKDLAAAALALNRLSSISRREADGRRLDQQAEREEAARIAAEQQRADAELVAKVESIATEAGLGADRIAAIRKGVLGLST